MPTPQEHKIRVERNHQAIQTCRRPLNTLPEWLVVMAFYQAAHAVETHLAQQGHLNPELRHPENHTMRRVGLRLSGCSITLYRDYNKLWQAAYAARYNAYDKFHHEYVEPAEVPALIQIAEDIRQAFCLLRLNRLPVKGN